MIRCTLFSTLFKVILQRKISVEILQGEVGWCSTVLIHIKEKKTVMFLKLEKEKRKRKLTVFAEVCSFQGGDPCSGEKSSPNREQTHSISIRNNVFPFTYFYVDNLTTGKVKHTIIYQLYHIAA